MLPCSVEAISAYPVDVDRPQINGDVPRAELAPPSADREHLESLARAFLDAALTKLAEERVLPVSPYRPWIHAGIDYPGPVIHDLPETRALEEAVESATPDRFKRPGQGVDVHRPHQYVLGLLESTVAALTTAGEPHTSAATPAVDRVQEFAALVTTEECTGSVVAFVAGIRLVTPALAIRHVQATRIDTTMDDVLGEIRDVPADLEELLRGSSGLPWEAGRLLLRADLDPNTGYSVFGIESARNEIAGLIAAARMLTNATVVNNGTVIGQRQLIPVHRGFQEIEVKQGNLVVWRPFHLSADTLQPLLAMKEWLSKALARDEPRSHVMSVAAGRFHAALDHQFWDEQLLEIAIGLEAALLGGDKEGEINYRLRARAAALLSNDEEPPERVFDDIGALYEMRSSLVHGMPIGDPDTRRLLAAMQSSQVSELAGERFAVSVDRARDLLRRAIIARLCLGEGETPRWPWTARDAFSVDRALLNPDTAREWRSFVRTRVAELGFPGACDPAEPMMGLRGQIPGNAK